MVKVENLSSSEIVLKFKSKTGGVYQKRLKPSSVLKVADEEYQLMLTPIAAIMETIKVSKYNIFGESKMIEIENATPSRVVINFSRSDTDSYQKILQPKAVLKLKPEEFAFIKGLDPRLIVRNMADADRLYFMPKISIAKEIPHDVVPSVVIEKTTEWSEPQEEIEPIQAKLEADVKRYKKHDKR
jgi:hypothetical protein